MKRLQMGQRQSDPGLHVDATRYVFMCPLCPWQLQAGYAARRDLGPNGLFDAIALAHKDHVVEAHANRSHDDELEWADGSTHNLAKTTPEGAVEGALIATELPRWWVDR
ncbi:hypothetical protein [Aeromicrobium sp. 9AM]|uniref:hypothetical protein n=1 Tax=Aeromicrobium sp. 9AM TaxID=2653126 RepID=UPI0012F21787|nr:hypothetical protein [Aeromicrobium sp. 9AM]VXC20933.1 hypothetical protein AERO9AM_50366 [Aeromicrobium sp. 9AM]